MNKLFRIAPAQRVLACAGAFVFCCCLGACEKGPRLGSSSRTLDLGRDTVTLPAGATLHEDTVKATAAGDFSSAQISARSTDFVRFTVGDNRTHALAIAGPTDQANALLDSTAQRRSPPLISKGQAWVISLKGLPAGTYSVSCASHNGTATLVVQ